MGVSECSDCHGLVSDALSACAHCGRPMPSMGSQERLPTTESQRPRWYETESGIERGAQSIGPAPHAASPRTATTFERESTWPRDLSLLGLLAVYGLLIEAMASASNRDIDVHVLVATALGRGGGMYVLGWIAAFALAGRTRQARRSSTFLATWVVIAFLIGFVSCVGAIR